MADKTKIEWCDATVNFWHGCTRVSPGCVNCYAETLAARWGVGWGPKAARKRIAGAEALARRLNRLAQRSGKRLRVFTNSMSDFFDAAVPGEWRSAAWHVIRECTALDWLILTKRPENFVSPYLPLDWGEGWPHVWLGVSAEDQERADERIPLLLQTPAAVWFVSAEPLLAQINFTGYRVCLDWVIVGGESGPNARPCDMSWVRSIVAQCRAAGVACFVKQLGGHPHDNRSGSGRMLCRAPLRSRLVPCGAGDWSRSAVLRDRKGGDPSEWSSDLRLREWPR